MKPFIVIAAISFCINAYSFSTGVAYINKGRGYNVSLGTQKTVSYIPAIRDQDSVGTCYGQSATVLLENYLCRTRSASCGRGELYLSALDVSSYDSYGKNSIPEGGFVSSILKNIKRSPDNYLAREECAPYQVLAEMNRLRDQNGLTDKFEYLEERFLAYKKSNNKALQIECFAKEIKSQFYLDANLQKIMDAFTYAPSAEQFRYKLLIPEKCHQKLGQEKPIRIPAYNIGAFPKRNETFTKESTKEIIEKLIFNNIPVNINFCATEEYHDKASGRMTCGLHAVVISGTRQVCNKYNICKKQFKIQNSYGKSWQQYNDDGWVMADKLASQILKFRKYSRYEPAVSWITKPNQKLKSLPRNPAFKADTLDVDDKVVAPPGYMYVCSGNSFSQTKLHADCHLKKI